MQDINSSELVRRYSEKAVAERGETGKEEFDSTQWDMS